MDNNNKNTIYVEANVMNMYPSHSFWREDFLILFFGKFTLYVAIATNQIGQNAYES